MIRYDFPNSYQSYVQCKSRARAIEALHVLLVPENKAKDHIWQLAQYHCVEKVCFSIFSNHFHDLLSGILITNIFISLPQILLAKCSNNEPNEKEEMEADSYASLFPNYKPLEAADAPKVTFNSAISLINRYNPNF